LVTLSRDLSDLVRQGLFAISQEAVDDFILDRAPGSDDFLEHFTQREREVLEMMSEGLSNKEIAAQLNISANTVKFHISSILGKLGASSRTEASTIGLRRGLITI
jgi:DNA-binding NarL/FixJ family response regulator